jgi:hypothetical protein
MERNSTKHGNGSIVNRLESTRIANIDYPAMREWARGKQRPANAERAQFRHSLTDEDRCQIEARIQQLVDDNPALSSTNSRTPDSKPEPPSVSVEVLDEYYFLRDIVG